MLMLLLEIIWKSHDVIDCVYYIGSYPNRTQCEWVVHGSSAVNSSVVLFMDDSRFKLEHDGECRYDFLQVREGKQPVL